MKFDIMETETWPLSDTDVQIWSEGTGYTHGSFCLSDNADPYFTNWSDRLSDEEDADEVIIPHETIHWWDLPDLLSEEKKRPLTLTIKEILSLARAAGVGIHDDRDVDQETLDGEITIVKGHPDGVRIEGTDGPYIKYRYVAIHNEYQDDGIFPLGDPIT